jgi:hypothetical protein
LVLESVAMKRCDSARSGRRSVEKLDAAAVRRSKVGREEARRSKGWECLLLKQPKLETVALDRHSLLQCLDEEPVTLSQDVAAAE